jgi:REP element-mobilizing transposase RayT
MPPPDPIYTAQNCGVAYQLNWSYSLFWNQTPTDFDWFLALQQACEADSIRLLQHAFKAPNISQFLISTKPEVAPVVVAQRVKGRLQHLIRRTTPNAFRRNYSIRSLGSTRGPKLDAYLASQLAHHPMADNRVQDRFERYQIHHPEIDLLAQRPTAHAIYSYSLHIVFVAEERWREIRDEVLSAVHDMIESASRSKNRLLGRASLLPDHVHLMVGCQPTETPEDAALSYLNNLAYAQDMRPVYRFSYFVGTYGEYDLGVIPRPVP